MENNNYKVYIKINEINCITNIESNLTLQDTTGYIQIDEGVGDKYVHAQGNYFPQNKPLRDIQGRCNYKFVDNEVVELTDEEKESLFPVQEVQPTEQEKLLSSVLLENAEIKEQLKQQQELSAILALQIAQLKGGNANV